MERNVHAKEESDREAARLLDVLDKVRLFPAGFPITQSGELELTSVGSFCTTQALAKWDRMPLEKVEEWALKTAEEAGSRA